MKLTYTQRSKRMRSVLAALHSTAALHNFDGINNGFRWKNLWQCLVEEFMRCATYDYCWYFKMRDRSTCVRYIAGPLARSQSVCVHQAGWVRSPFLLSPEAGSAPMVSGAEIFLLTAIIAWNYEQQCNQIELMNLYIMHPRDQVSVEPNLHTGIH